MRERMNMVQLRKTLVMTKRFSSREIDAIIASVSAALHHANDVDVVREEGPYATDLVKLVSLSFTF